MSFFYSTALLCFTAHVYTLKIFFPFIGGFICFRFGNVSSIPCLIRLRANTVHLWIFHKSLAFQSVSRISNISRWHISTGSDRGRPRESHVKYELQKDRCKRSEKGRIARQLTYLHSLMLNCYRQDG